MVALLLRRMLVGSCTPAHKRNLYRLAALLLVMAACGAVRAQEMVPGYSDNFYDLDAREVRLLPPYCVYSQYFDQKYRTSEAEKKRWMAALGPTFIHVHHYCFALLKTNRALFLTKEKRFREFYLRDSLNEFDYVIQRSPDNFVLLPEILTKKGENLVRLGRGSFAVFEFERAIQLNPNFWPPYAQLADYYKEAGEKEKAREVLSKGLSQTPDAKGLQRRLAELDHAVARQE
jgi:tetratricopeptide (TPR) repeat protein